MTPHTDSLFWWVKGKLQLPPLCIVENIQVVAVIAKGFVYLLISVDGQVILFLPIHAVVWVRLFPLCFGRLLGKGLFLCADRLNL